MSQLHVRQIRARLEATFKDLINLSDFENRPKKDQDDIFLSRALAAYTITALTEATPAVAASHVIDGYGDNGIDAVYFVEDERKLFIIQSKWMNSGTGAPGLGDIHKALTGFRNLVDGKFDRFNPKLTPLIPTIESALDDTATKLYLVFSYTGSSDISTDGRRVIGDLVEEYNDTSDILEQVTLNQKDLYKSISDTADGSPINFETMIYEWGQVQEPYRAIYGQVQTGDIARWPIAGGRLFSRNLRKIIANSDVNRQIANTLKNTPSDFWYFNNGITVLCQSIKKKPYGGTDRSNGVFVFEGASVVNGAQTVGSIVAAHAQDPDNKTKGAKVLVRFISLEGCPDDFSEQVTRATNTQNRIESRDFAALDPQQERLRRELNLDGRSYIYKTGDSPPLPTEGCTIEEATIALACAHSEVNLAVIAKSQIGKLWENIERPPYKLLFNSSVSSHRLWASVEILRAIEEALKPHQWSQAGKLRPIAVHGNRFIAHEVFKRLPVAQFDASDFNLEACKASVASIVSKVIERTHTIFMETYSKSYPQSFFKNATKCRAVDLALAQVQPTQP